MSNQLNLKDNATRSFSVYLFPQRFDEVDYSRRFVYLGIVYRSPKKPRIPCIDA
jgi:hypothetical protein